MRFRKLAANTSEGNFWQTVAPLSGERHVNSAHLVAAFVDHNEHGTAFLTTRRLAWRSTDGHALDLPLVDMEGWALRTDAANPLGLALGPPASTSDDPGILSFYPQKPRSAANRALARAFYESLAAQLSQVQPNR